MEESRKLKLQNRLVTRERNRYLTLLESLSIPVILADEKNQFEYMNHEAALLFENRRACGMKTSHFAEDDAGNPATDSAVGSVFGRRGQNLRCALLAHAGYFRQVFGHRHYSGRHYGLQSLGKKAETAE
ncbi:MAG: hypothetical protein P8X90_29910 [Desulfobacterales bacterium]